MAGLDASNDIIAGLAHADKIQYEHDLKHPISSVSDISVVNDGIHDGLEFPTEEEKYTLRRVSDSVPWNAYRSSTIFAML